MRLEFDSERLHFRPLLESDLDLEIALWTDVEVARFVTGRASTVAEIKELMPMVTQRTGNGCVGFWCLSDKSTQEKVGHAALLPLPIETEDTEFELLEREDWPDRDIEVGVILKRNSWGLGFATEACTRLLDFAFDETDLDAVLATTDPENRASQRMLRKSGMRDIGFISAYAGRYPGFRLTREQWKTKKDTGSCC